MGHPINVGQIITKHQQVYQQFDKAPGTNSQVYYMDELSTILGTRSKQCHQLLTERYFGVMVNMMTITCMKWKSVAVSNEAISTLCVEDGMQKNV